MPICPAKSWYKASGLVGCYPAIMLACLSKGIAGLDSLIDQDGASIALGCDLAELTQENCKACLA